VYAAGRAESLFSTLASFHFDGRFHWAARRRANTWCPRGRALSASTTAIRPGASVRQPKLTESKKRDARSPRTTARLFRIMSGAVSLRSALCPHAPPAAALPSRLGSRLAG
jgi:hypothetical protein